MNPTVPGEGPLSCGICFVGEAPGEWEERQRRPFVGPAGKLFDDLLRRAGIVRGACRVTNVVKERPAKNDISWFIDLSKKEPRLTPSAREYIDYLKEELSQCSANVIVPLGNVPLWVLTGRKGILKWRGSILESTLLPGRKVIPTIHPSAALREYLFEHFIMHDLKKVVREMNSPDIALPVRLLRLRPSYVDCLEYLNRCNNAPIVAFDIEVLNDQVSCISFALSATDAISIPFLSHGNDYFSPEQEARIWKEIAVVLENKRVMKIGQNVIFDCTFLLSRYGIRTRPVQCTMVAQAVMYPDFPKGLDFITSTYTDEPYYKDEGKKHLRMGTTEEAFWRYNALDSAVCFEAFPKQLLDLSRAGNQETYIRQVSLIEPLMYMQVRGFRTDDTGLNIASCDAADRICKLTAELQQICGFDINPNSPKQLQAYFYGAKGIQPYISRKTGNPTTDDDAMKRLARRGIKEAVLIRDIRKWSKLQGTYFNVKLDSDKRMRGAMNPGGTTTGRLSSSKTIFDTGGNMQNQPPAFRRFLVADPGCFFLVPDLSQAENRIVAYIAPEPAMQHAFENGIDIHRQTAGLIFDKPLAEISDEPGSSKLGTGEHSERDWGKKANHSLNYGLGYRSFALRFELPESEAKFIWERYHKVYPGVQQQYHRWVRNQLSENRTLTNPYGRRRMFLNRWGDDLFQDAFAFTPQSTVADKINKDGILFIQEHQELFRPMELLNQIHDSLVLQVSYETVSMDRIAEMMDALNKSLTSPVPWKSGPFSIPSDVKVGINLADMVKVKDPSDPACLEEALQASIKLAEEKKTTVELNGLEEEAEV